MRTTIVSTVELAEHPEWRVFDCRNELSNPERGVELYAQGHIPGAVHAHLERHLSGPKTGSNGRHPLPDPQQFAGWLGEQGLRPTDQVVAYDSAGTSYAARLWWMLNWVGHRAVAVLDGGYEKWLAEGRPVTSEVRKFSPSVFAARPDDSMWVDVACVERNLHGGEAIVLDARSANRYAGIGETLDPVAGHIPGALNRPYTENLDAQGRFKSPDQLRREFTALLDQSPPAAVVSHCGSGVTACHHLLAMRIAGFDGGRLYPGSWSEWCSDRSRPIVVGSEPR